MGVLAPMTGVSKPATHPRATFLFLETPDCSLADVCTPAAILGHSLLPVHPVHAPTFHPQFRGVLEALRVLFLCFLLPVTLLWTSLSSNMRFILLIILSPSHQPSCPHSSASSASPAASTLKPLFSPCPLPHVDN